MSFADCHAKGVDPERNSFSDLDALIVASGFPLGVGSKVVCHLCISLLTADVFAECGDGKTMCGQWYVFGKPHTPTSVWTFGVIEHDVSAYRIGKPFSSQRRAPPCPLMNSLSSC